MPACKNTRCRQLVVLADTARGRVIALDARPALDGTYRLDATAFGRPLAVYVGQQEHPDDADPELATLYRVHVATCAGRKPPPVRGWRKRAAES